MAKALSGPGRAARGPAASPPAPQGGVAFYPMSGPRPAANWYQLPFDRRRELMHGHGKVGRRYSGRVLQLVTGSTGLDDFGGASPC